ncbi:Ig-like domain-containing protein [Mucilaginibacter arboris]|uniref:T9SS type B sorting domain-containing protein n=1 Tax=Mucilaginibacter arboris TaxID=2682090 RepID=A0A7K1SX31_9SPHI|nr:Ig-like domain-containing protein [Mucilaginibacter arboris]MVN21798.1 T9SS type B sorting domain-containing protein [Mucilaginibacter arboris]
MLKQLQILILLLFLAGLISNKAFAQFPYTNGFTNSTAPGLNTGGTALLTATRVPGDAEGNGYLRLTSNSNNQAGYAFVSNSFPATKGISVAFEYSTYGSSNGNADGISFFLFDGSLPDANFRVGYYGGSLGYSNSGSNAGLSRGYLGIGIDEYGNFSDPNFGVGGTGRATNSVTIRGAYNDPSGAYRMLRTVQLSTSTHGFNTIAGGNRGVVNTAGYRKAYIDVVPDASGVGYDITVKIQHDAVSAPVTIINNYYYNYPAPSTLKFGYAASTGAENNYHEIRNTTVDLPAASKATLTAPTQTNQTLNSCSNGTGSVNISSGFSTSNGPNGVINTASTDLDPSTAGTQTTYFVASKGTFTSDGSGIITFTPLNSSVTGTAVCNFTVGDNYNSTSNTATVTAIINAVPTLTITNPAAVCAPATVDLTAAAVTAGSDAGLTFSYYSNAAATTVISSPAAIASSGTYYIKAVNISGCSVIQPVTVIINPQPTTANAGTIPILTTATTTSATLNGNQPTAGTGSWSQISGPTTATFVNAALYNTSVGNLAPGTYVFRWSITNSCNTSTSNVTITVKSSNANLTNLTLSAGTLLPAFTAAIISYTATVADNAASITLTPFTADPNATVKINNTTVVSGNASGPIDLPVGSTNVQIVVTAQDGVTTKTYNVNVTRPATIAPSVPVLVSGTITNSNTPTITGTSEAGSTVTLYDGTTVIGTATADGSGNWSIVTSTLIDGTHSLTATATFPNNVSPRSSALTITVDTTAPAVASILAPANGNISANTRPVITGTAEANSTVSLYDGTTLIGTTTANPTGNWSIIPVTALADGSHSLTVTAKDAAGNVSAASTATTITVDTTAPLAPSVPALASGGTITGNNRPTVTGTAEAGSTVTLYDGTTVIGTATADANGNWSITPAITLADGNHNLTTKAKDAAGNVSAASPVATITVDTVPPVTPSVPVLASLGTITNNNKPTVTGTAEPGSTVILYDGTTVIGTATADANGNWSITPATALADGNHSLAVAVKDAAGNMSTVSTATTITVDTIAPAAPSVPVLASGGTITNNNKPTITGTAEPGSTVTLYDGTTVIGTTTADASGNWSITPATALADGSHNLTTKAKDAAGNISAASATTITVDTIVPAAPSVPVLASGGTITNNNKPTITGTAEPGSTVTLYDGTTVIGTATADASGNWSITPATVLADGSHNLTTKAKDAAGNVSAASVVAAVTVDTKAPAVPVIAGDVNKGSVNTTKPTIAGTAEAGSTVSIYMDGILLATVTADANGNYSYTPTTALALGGHKVNVTATDIAGNVSASTNVITFSVDLAPTGLALNSIALYENQPSGTSAGTLSSADPNASSTFTYALVSGAGSADNASFSITGNKLVTTKSFDYEVKSSYSVRIRTTNQYGLYFEQSFTINISDVNEAPTLAAISNQTVCYTYYTQTIRLSGITAGSETGQSTTLSVSSTNPGLFANLKASSVSSGQATLSYDLATTGSAVVTVTVKDNGGTDNGGTDSFSQTFTITANELPIAAITSDKGAQISKGETVTLTATGGSSYSWDTSPNVSGTSSSAVIKVRPSQTTTYQVTVSNASGCSAKSSITINVTDDYSMIDAANILTPNGDGKNDTWIVKNLDLYPDNTVSIFDKGGRKLLEVKHYNNDWDGSFQGSPLAEGTYYYVIDFGPGKGPKKGFITILRNR